jgi:VCBS repeat-containing protein
VASAIDREADGASRNITIRATSADGSFTDQIFSIAIVDANEFAITAPIDTNAATNNVDENVAIGTVVGITVSSSDADATTNTVTYSLLDNDGGNFTIDANSGTVTTAALLNRETLGASRNITVRATSVDGSTADTVFSISINDLDEFNVGVVLDTNGTANVVNEYSANGSLVGVTANALDADATNNAITYSLDDSAGGRFTIDGSTGVVTVADGSLLNASLAASHNITVRAVSSDGSFNTQIFNIVVSNINDSPTANADSATAVEAGGTANGTSGSNPTGNVLSNDTDPDVGDTNTVSGVAAGVQGSASGSVGSAVSGNYGSISIAADGTFTYAVNNANAVVQALAAGQSLTDVFTYTMQDSGGLTSTTQVTITIQGANDAPVEVSIENSVLVYTENDGSVAITSSLEVSDVDDTNIESAVVGISGNYITGQDILSFADQNGITGAWNASTGELTLTGSGTLAQYQAALRSITYTNTSEEPNNVTRTVSLTISDGNLNSNTSTRDIQIVSVNDAPVITGGPDTSSLTETNAGLADSGSLTVTDVDVTDNVTAAVDSLVVSGSGASSVPGSLTNAMLQSFLTVTPTAILNGTQTTNTLTWNFNSGSEAFNFLATGETLILTYTVSVTDDDGTPLSDTETVTVTITGTNDEQVLSINTGISVIENALVNVIAPTMLTTTDVDNIDANLVYTITGTTVNGTIRLNGIALGINDTFTQDDVNQSRLSYDHNGSETSSDSLTFAVDDGAGVVSNGTFSISVTLINDNTPIVGANQTLFIVETSNVGTIAGIVIATDVDLNTSFQAWQIVGGDPDGRFMINAATGEITLSIADLDFEVRSSYSLLVQVSDGTFTSTPEWITIAITNDNEAPVANADQYTTMVSQSIRLESPTPIANDTDVDGNPLTIVITNGPVHGTLSVDPDGVLRYTPDPSFFGIDTIVYQASDGTLLSAPVTIFIDVQTIIGGGDGGGGGNGGGGNGGGGNGGGGNGGGNGGSGTPPGEQIGPLGNPSINSTLSQNQASEAESGHGRRQTTVFRVLGQQTIAFDSFQESYGAFSNQAIEWTANVVASAIEQASTLHDQAISWAKWDDAQETEELQWDFSIGAVAVTAGLLSVGYVLWALRGGVFIATVFSGIPSWRLIDPSTLLEAHRSIEKNENDEIENMLS